jgi:oligopeptide/dipeptide ABC transporter ATP-binding protein
MLESTAQRRGVSVRLQEKSLPVLSVRGLVIEDVTLDQPETIVDHLSFDVAAGSVLGIVGESGSGKTLTMLAVMGLLPHNLSVTGGEIWLEDQNLLTLSATELRSIMGNRMTMIFQDPMTSLNPVISVGKQIGEIIQIHNPGVSRSEVRDRVIDLLLLVGIPDPGSRYRHFAHELSGGMRQRAMIAMAVANSPTLLIADEPTTALDVTIQAQVLEVLAAVRERTGASMVLVTHDLGLVAETADDVGVMYGGRMMEYADVETLFAHPSHPYTVGLFKSLPRADSELTELYSIAGQPPAVGAYPSGCVFHPRCGVCRGRAICVDQEPERKDLGGGHESACHFVAEVTSWAEAPIVGRGLEEIEPS